MPSRSRARLKRRCFAVPTREGEHADQPLERGLDAPCVDRLDDDFSIGMAPEAAAERFELGP